MDNLGDAVDALVKAAKIAIDQTADEIDSKINDAIERLQDISIDFITPSFNTRLNHEFFNSEFFSRKSLKHKTEPASGYLVLLLHSGFKS